MKKNKHKGIYLIIWLLVAIIIVFVIITNKNNSPKTNDPIIESNLDLYPKKNDDNAISFEVKDTILNSNLNLNSDFEETQLEYNIIPYYVKCKTYDSNEFTCKEVTVSILNIQLDVELDNNICSPTNEILWVNKYFIRQYTSDCSSACGNIDVSYSDEEVYNIENVIANPKITESNDYNYVRYHDKYIYYFVDDGEYVLLKKLNLDGNEFKEEIIGKIKNTFIKCGK